MFSYYGKFQVKGMIHLLQAAVSWRMVHVLNAFHLFLDGVLLLFPSLEAVAAMMALATKQQ